MNRPRSAWAVGCALLAASALPGCAPGVAPRSAGVIPVVAAESMWGSIAAQLGGDRVSVTSIVSDPNADPHEYESSAGDARAFATATYIIVNGAGYDAWATTLLGAT